MYFKTGFYCQVTFPVYNCLFAIYKRFSNFYRGQKGEQKCLVNSGVTTFSAHSKDQQSLGQTQIWGWMEMLGQLSTDVSYLGFTLLFHERRIRNRFDNLRSSWHKINFCSLDKKSMQPSVPVI